MKNIWLFCVLLLLVSCFFGCTAPNQVCGVCGLEVGAPYSIQLNVLPGATCPGTIVNGACIVSGLAPISGCIEIPSCKSWDWFAMAIPPGTTKPYTEKK